MAAAVVAIPAVLTAVQFAVGTLGPLVSSLIGRAETIFSKPLSGQSKLSWVLGGIKALLDPLSASGVAPVVPPTDTEITAIIEAVLSQMKQAGTLQAPASIAGAAAPSSSSGTVQSFNVPIKMTFGV
jgi:hypothetical protein